MIFLCYILTGYDFNGELLEKQVVVDVCLLFGLEGGCEEQLVLVGGSGLGAG